MSIKISVSEKDSGQKKIKIKKNTGLMPVVFYNTANGKKYRLYLSDNLVLNDIYSLLRGLGIIVCPPEHFDWEFYLKDKRLNLRNTLGENKISDSSVIDLRCKEYPAEEISVKIVSDVGKYDVIIPAYLTLGDVMDRMISEKILRIDEFLLGGWLYSDFSDGESQCECMKYDCLEKTIKEYGWKSGQIIKISSSCVDGVPRLLNVCLPDSRLLEIEFGRYDKDGIMIFDLIEEKTGMSLSTNNSPENRSFYYLFDERAKAMTLRQSMHLGCCNECFAFDESGWAIAKYPLQLKKQIVEELN